MCNDIFLHIITNDGQKFMNNGVILSFFYFDQSTCLLHIWKKCQSLCSRYCCQYTSTQFKNQTF